MASSPRLDSLTGLRFVAALAVFAVHAEVFFGGTGRQVVEVFFDQGGVGVAFFFMLSGFVLTWSQRDRDSSGGFYRRRAARILPLYYVSTLICLAVMQVEHGLGNTVGLPGWVASLTGVQAWVPRSGLYQGGNGVLWSLSAEMFFYLLFPMIYRLLARLAPNGLRAAAATVAAFSIIVPIIVPVGPVWQWLVYICPAFRISEFILGILLALLVRRGLRFPLAPATVLAVAGWLMAGQVPTQLQNVSVTVVPFALLIVAVASSDIGGRNTWMRSRTAVLLGEWSFAFYVFHKLVIRVALTVFGDGHTPGLATLLTVACLGVSVAVAAAAFYWIERPLERRLRRDGTLPETVAPVPS